jgi:cytochrome P450
MSSFDESQPGPPCVHAQFDVGSTDDTLPHMIRDFAALGEVYRVIAPGREREAWVVSEPDTIKRVLVSNHRNYTIGVGLDRVKVLVGNGIIVSEGELWKRQHRMMQPMFQRSQIERFGSMIVDVTQRRLAYLVQQCGCWRGVQYHEGDQRERARSGIASDIWWRPGSCCSSNWAAIRLRC